MDKTNHCNISNSTLLVTNIISSTFPIGSLVACALALVLIAYYKLHHSFNYRLVLYLLVSHLLNSTTYTLQVPFLWLKDGVEEEQNVIALCVVVEFMKVYCTWSVALTTAIVTVEISSVMMHYYQLRIKESILIIICFFLPILNAFIPLMTELSSRSTKYYTCAFKLNNCHTNTLDMYMYVEYIPITIITCIGMAAMGTALFRLLYSYVRLKLTSTNQEEQPLVNQHIETRCQEDALKEILPFIVYPSISLVSLVIYYLHLIPFNQGPLDYTTALIAGSTGAICSGAFFIHLATIGKEGRNAMERLQQAYNSFDYVSEGHTQYQ